MKTRIIKYELSNVIDSPGAFKCQFCLTQCPYAHLGSTMVGGIECIGLVKWGKQPCQYMVAHDPKERTVTCCHPDIERE